MRRRIKGSTSNSSRAGLAILAVAALAITVFAATGSAATKALPTLTYGIPQATLSLDPASGSSVQPYHYLGYDSLIRVNAHGSFIPNLATGWQYVGKNNDHFRITLRTDAKFADGNPVNSTAVKNWFAYCAKQAAMARTLLGGGVFTNLDTDGPNVVDFSLSKPNPFIPRLLVGNWGMIAAPSGIANPNNLANGNVMGAGPYQLDSNATVIGSEYDFVPNPNYYNKKQIHYSKIAIKVITTSTSMLQATLTGQLDVAQGDTNGAAAAKKKGFDIKTVKQGVIFFHIDDRNGEVVKALGDIRVRQAIELAINRAAITKATYGQYAEPTSNVEYGDGYDKNLNNFWKYNPTKAKSLMAAAGYSNGFEFTVIGHPQLDISKVLYPAAQDLAKIGITMNIYQPAVSADYSAAARLKKYQAAEITTNFNGTGSSIYTNHYQNYFQKGAAGNTFAATDSVLDGLATSVANGDNLKANMQKMSRRIISQAYEVPIMRFQRIYYVNPKKVKNFNIYPSVPNPRIQDWVPVS